MSAQLTLRREPHVAMELRRGPFEITLDGTAVGSIARHETFETAVAAGSHTLQVRTGRYSSKAESFVVGDGDGVRYRCSGARLWPVYLLSLIVPALALPLERE